MTGKERIRLVAVDLDQTLLRSDKTFSEYSKDVVARLVRAGYLVVPASGRDLYRMQDNILTVPGIRYAVGLNGSRVYELGNVAAGDSRTIADFGLDVEQSCFSLDYMRPFCDILEVDTDEGLLMEMVTDSPEAVRFIRDRYFFINFDVPAFSSLSEHIRERGLKVWKTSAFYADRGRFDEIRKIEFPRRDIDFCVSDDLMTETCSAEASKGNGLRALMEYLKIPAEKVLAVGDNGNDVSMFHTAGISAAVGNALPEVQAEADFVADTNDNDGAAKFLEEFLLS